MASERDKLAEVITSHTVTWELACQIADSILDGGYASPSDLTRNMKYSYDEGVDFAVDILERERKVAIDLRGEEFDERDVTRIQNTIDVSSGYTYGIYDANVSALALTDVIAELEADNKNPHEG